MQTKKDAVYYGLWSAMLLVTEILIASVWKGLYYLRAYGGDILVIPLIYCLVRIFVKILPRGMPLLMCGVGFFAETAQYFHLSDRLGFARGSLPAIIIGTSFSWWDILCYTAGMLLIYLVILLRKSVQNRNNRSSKPSMHI